MGWTYPDAQEWARQESLANAPRLARLESFAFQAHPEVVATLGADGASLAALATAPETTRMRSLGMWGAVLAYILLVFVASAGGVAVLVVGRNLSALTDPFATATAITASGALFLGAIAGQLVLWGTWLHDGRYWSPVHAGLGVFGAVAGIVAIAAAGIRASEEDAPGTTGWMVPMVVTAVLGVALAIAVYLRKAHRAPEDGQDAPTPQDTALASGADGTASAGSLPRTEQDRIRADVDAALHILADRGLLDDAELARALDTPLGRLRTLDPLRPE